MSDDNDSIPKDLEADTVGYEPEHAATRELVTRTLSRKLTGADQLYEEAENSAEPMPPMGGGKELPPQLPDRLPYVVEWDGPDDPEFPHNWALSRKIAVCVDVGLSALAVTLGSAMFAQGLQPLMHKFHIGSVTATLGTSLFVFGFASGPILWGPLSELYGRKTVLIPLAFGYVCFSFMVGAANDISMIMICRFFAGFVGAAPLVAAPAAMLDVFDARTRGRAMAIFAMVLFGGPMLAPIFGGFTVKNPHLGWRWTSFFPGIVAAIALAGIVLDMDETHHGIILARRAETLRRRTRNWGIYAPHEEMLLSIREIAEKNIMRPLYMLCTEPILLLITIYNAFIYGLLYLFLTAIPLIFVGGYHFSPGVGELPYLLMFIGIVIGGAITLYLEKRFLRALEANNGKPVPEERLPPMMLGSVIFAAGLFWLCWAGNYADRVHWIVPTLGAAPIGCGLLLVFLPCLNYIIDCYLLFAASALAGNTFLRLAFGAIFPLFARQMFTKMKIKWAGTLLGLVAVALVPVPFLFYKYGKLLRQRSKFAFDM